MPKGAKGALYDGAKDTDKFGSGLPKESAVQDGPSYDSRPRPGKGRDIGPTAPAIYKNPRP